MSSTEIILLVREDEIDGGYTASALGYGIHTQGEDWNDLKAMVRDAVLCHFDNTMPPLKLIHLHFVRDEVLLV
jgi:hypothetical protein